MAGQDKVSYTWKVDGPDNDDPGSRFDPSVELLDPWAKAVDTACSISLDIIKPEQQQAIKENSIQVYSHSIVVCESRLN